MHKEIIYSSEAPAAVGPYSQAVRCGSFLFTAGQVGLNPATGALVEDDIAVQTTRALHNLKAVLSAGGADFASVVKTTVFLKDMAEFGAMNEVYKTFFGDSPPARSAVQVAALPLGARVEIEAVAYLPD
ncbi:MAG: RidA family protein [Candidatus Promineifilaceae bacterium]